MMFFHYPFTDVVNIGLESFLRVEFLSSIASILWQSHAEAEVDM